MIPSNDINQLYNRWLFLIASILVLTYILFFYDFINTIIRNDITYISIFIIIIFFIYTIFVGKNIKKLQAISDLIHDKKIIENQKSLLSALEKSDYNDNYYGYCVHSYIQYSFNSKQRIESNDNENNNFEIKMTKYTDTVWFVVDLLIKLGLVGTVIGFIIMLSSIVTIEDFDLSLMRSLLQEMSGGMMVALYTTLTGLVSSILLAFQNKMLETAVYEIYSYTRDINFKFTNQ